MSPAVAQRQPLTRWSPNDPAISYKGNPDHHTKLRLKFMAGPPSNTTSGIHAKEDISTTALLTARRSITAAPPGARFGDGRFDSIGHAAFAKVQLHPLRGMGSGDVASPRPHRSSSGRLSRDALQTSYNERARSGYVYWYMPRPKPTQFGRYGIGSYKTVLGLGNGPRS